MIAYRVYVWKADSFGEMYQKENEKDLTPDSFFEFHDNSEFGQLPNSRILFDDLNNEDGIVHGLQHIR